MVENVKTTKTIAREYLTQRWFEQRLYTSKISLDTYINVNLRYAEQNLISSSPYIGRAIKEFSAKTGGTEHAL